MEGTGTSQAIIYHARPTGVNSKLWLDTVEKTEKDWYKLRPELKDKTIHMTDVDVLRPSDQLNLRQIVENIKPAHLITYNLSTLVTVSNWWDTQELLFDLAQKGVRIWFMSNPKLTSIASDYITWLDSQLKIIKEIQDHQITLGVRRSAGRPKKPIDKDWILELSRRGKTQSEIVDWTGYSLCRIQAVISEAKKKEKKI